MATSKNVLKASTSLARENVALRKKVATLQTPLLSKKIARSKRNYDRVLAETDGNVAAAQLAAMSSIEGTCKGDLVRALYKRGAGMYAVSALRKSVKDYSAKDVYTALDMLVSGFALRKLAGYTLAVDTEKDTVSFVAREKAKAVAKVAKPKAAKAIAVIPQKAEDAA